MRLSHPDRLKIEFTLLNNSHTARRQAIFRSGSRFGLTAWSGTASQTKAGGGF
jgi:hypothetical protein